MEYFFLLLGLGALSIALILTGIELEEKHPRVAVLCYIVALLCVIALWFVNEVT